jgi:hypothetical protein
VLQSHYSLAQDLYFLSLNALCDVVDIALSAARGIHLSSEFSLYWFGLAEMITHDSCIMCLP